MNEKQLQHLFATHNKALSSHYGDALHGMKFLDPELYEQDSVVSNSKTKKEAFITRHYVTGHHMDNAPTHVVVLKGNTYDRL